jgi:hypothetical protein
MGMDNRDNRKQSDKTNEQKQSDRNQGEHRHASPQDPMKKDPNQNRQPGQQQKH